jgi:hypothetical protein
VRAISPSDRNRVSVKGTRLEQGRELAAFPGMIKRSPCRYFRTSPEIIRIAVMLYGRVPPSLRSVEDLPHGTSAA